MDAMIEIGPLRLSDRATWEVLARGYKAFYRNEVSPEGYEQTWQRLQGDGNPCALGATLDGRLVGIAHYLFHATVWGDDSCYLQDLFVDEAARGHGVARTLIEAVANDARDRGLTRLYWHTQQDNATARALYDKVAVFRGFLCYDVHLVQD
jgi:GNAT superfamily N-acetyltransferase